MTTPAERRSRIVAIVEGLVTQHDEDAGLALAELFGEIAKATDNEEMSPLAAEALADIGRALFPHPPHFEVGQEIWLGGEAGERPCQVTVEERWLGPTDGLWEYLLRFGWGDEEEGIEQEEALEAARI